ncbi:hypothetical protein [Bifidobacterium adolescentis]|uniref:hypothetical protein n=1 Tax=Bifidobacterium adolescentis TaxID=1680 RepID=UPI003D797BCE
MDNLTKRYAISKDASEVINLLRLLSIVFVVLIHNTPAVPSRIIFSSGMGQWFYGLMRHTILDPPIYVFHDFRVAVVQETVWRLGKRKEKSTDFVDSQCILESVLDWYGVYCPKNRF